MIIKEACVESFLDAKIMVEAGANRIELCENLSVGGTTPSYGTIIQCLKNLNVPLLVMIRPRGGNFIYSDDEIEIMSNDILLCKELGVKGIVLGVLNEKNEIHIPQLKYLVKLAKPMEITFHKAIDEVPDPLKALDILIELGIDRILTSGKAETALAGKELINKLIFAGKDKIQIVVAGKVTKENFQSICREIPNNEYHGKKIVI